MMAASAAMPRELHLLFDVAVRSLQLWVSCYRFLLYYISFSPSNSDQRKSAWISVWFFFVFLVTLSFIYVDAYGMPATIQPNWMFPFTSAHAWGNRRPLRNIGCAFLVRSGPVCVWHANEYIKYYYIQTVCVFDMRRHIDYWHFGLFGGSGEIRTFLFWEKKAPYSTHIGNTKTIIFIYKRTYRIEHAFLISFPAQQNVHSSQRMFFWVFVDGIWRLTGELWGRVIRCEDDACTDRAGREQNSSIIMNVLF